MTFLSSLSPHTLRGKTCLLRIDINAEGEEIKHSLRVLRVKKTVSFLSSRCKRVIILAHRGRPDISERDNPSYSLTPFVDDLSETWGIPLSFISATTVSVVKKELATKKEKVLLLENIRLFDGEYRNCKRLSTSLASLADIYVNDAFSNSHREHASMVGVASLLPSYGGWGLEEEIAHINEVKENMRDTVLVLGGAKISEKLKVIETLLPDASALLLGGGPANTALKRKGWDVKDSLFEDVNIDNLLTSPKVYIPKDVIWENGRIVDIGEDTEKQYQEILSSHSSVLWNGPLGHLERGYTDGTDALIKTINECRMSGIIGGGETVSYAQKHIVSDQMFLSTGGGALLTYLSSGLLVGLDVLSS